MLASFLRRFASRPLGTAVLGGAVGALGGSTAYCGWFADRAAAAAGQKKEPEDPSASAETEKRLYAFGRLMGEQLADLKCFGPDELDIIIGGLRSYVLEEPVREDVDMDFYGVKASLLLRDRMKLHKEQQTERNVAEGKAALAKAAAEPGAKRTKSGLVFQEVACGTGAAPKATDTVRVHYEGRLLNGTVFDSSFRRGQAAEFPLNAVIKGWTEGAASRISHASVACPTDPRLVHASQACR